MQPVAQNLVLTSRVSRNQGMKSRFDMPIEFHIDFLRESLSNKEPPLKGSSMRTSISGAAGRRSRFEDLDPKFFYKRMSMKPTFDFMRELAIEMLQSDVNKKLSILQDNEACKKDQAIFNEPLPHKLYSWMREDFVPRRRLSNCMWIVVLEKNLPAQCLEILKFKTDLENLQLFLDLIFAGCLCADEEIDIKEHVLNYIQDAYDFLSISENLDREVKVNKNILNQGINKLVEVNNSRRESKEEYRRNSIENALSEVFVWKPIEFRYQVSYYDNRTEQSQIKEDIIADKLKADKEAILELIEKENRRARSAIDMYFTEIELFKQRTAVMTNLYENDYERYDNELTYRKISLDKLREQRKFMVEQMERFRQDLEQLRLKIIAEAEQAALKAQELEAGSKKKGKKGKGKGKGKAKGKEKKKK